MLKNIHEAAAGMEGASIEQVRELLFGSQFKELEIRVQRQEELFQQEIADTRDALKKRLDSLENFMKSEIASMLNRINMEKAERDSAFRDAKRELDEAIKNEQRERGDALAQAGKELAAASGVFERRLSALSSSLDNTEHELRQLLLTESGGLSDKIEERYQQALDTLRGTSEHIRHDMVHRNALSALFTETAFKLSEQWAAEVADESPGKPSAGPEKFGQRKSGKQSGSERGNA